MSATRETAYNYMRRNNLECPLVELHLSIFRQLVRLFQLP